MSNNHQRAIYNVLTEKTIAYNAGLAKALGCAKAGILLSQLLYWSGKGKDKEWFYKTVEELYEETALTKYEQLTAIKKCKDKGVLDIKLKGIPAKRHFRVNLEKLIDLLSSCVESRQQVVSKPYNSIEENQTRITDSTPKNTTNNKDTFYKKEIAELAKRFTYR